MDTLQDRFAAVDYAIAQGRACGEQHTQLGSNIPAAYFFAGRAAGAFAKAMQREDWREVAMAAFYDGFTETYQPGDPAPYA